MPAFIAVWRDPLPGSKHLAVSRRKHDRLRRMSDDDLTRRRQDAGNRWLTAAAFVAVLALLVGGFLLFPTLQRYITFQDCTASGRTDCVPTGFTPR